MKKSIFFINLVVILGLGYFQISKINDYNKKITYSFSLGNSDVSIKNFRIIREGGVIFIPEGLYLENYTDKTIDFLKVSVVYGKEELYYFNIQDVGESFTEKYTPKFDETEKHIQIVDNPILGCEVLYRFQGEDEYTVHRLDSYVRPYVQ